MAGNCLIVTTGKIAAAWTMLLPLFAVFTARLGWSLACCESNAVCAVIPSAVAAYRELVLLRLALSLTASLPYLSPALNHFEDRLGKHDVAVSSKLLGLIEVPAGPLVFSFAALEDIRDEAVCCCPAFVLVLTFQLQPALGVNQADVRHEQDSHTRSG
jgi:hypothetical protein